MPIAPLSMRERLDNNAKHTPTKLPGLTPTRAASPWVKFSKDPNIFIWVLSAELLSRFGYQRVALVDLIKVQLIIST